MAHDNGIEKSKTTLLSLIRGLDGQLSDSTTDPVITGIALDSRLVLPGYLFVALEGGNTDGHRYIPAAVQKGAAAILGTQEVNGLPVPYLRVTDGRLALAWVSAALYGYPARKLTVIGVTGTDGKTTTSNMIYAILRSAGLPVGMISTVNAMIGDEVLDTGFHVTTPEAPDVQRYLAQMVAAGLTHAILESTSHGLAQQRVGACEFDAGVVTNITHEHLDYHGTYAAYREAKARLFSYLAQTREKPQGNFRLAILNRDDISYDYLTGVLEANPQPDQSPMTVISYGVHPEAIVRAESVTETRDGLHFKAVGPGFGFEVFCPLAGGYNVSNCLAAIALTVAGMDLPYHAAQDGIAALDVIPGRMERIDLGQDFQAIVDFAHTPNALHRSLQAARQFTCGKIIAVFGSAGLRDREKRRMMAEVGAELADISVLTAEDPRTESLDGILAEMASGARTRGGIEGKNYWRIKDRGEAIRFAVRLAHRGDLVIALGKGHEQSMCFGTVEYPWDDRTALRAALADRLGKPGPEMPYLPTQDE